MSKVTKPAAKVHTVGLTSTATPAPQSAGVRCSPSGAIYLARLPPFVSLTRRVMPPVRATSECCWKSRGT
jgi:hypothetical protein